MAYVKTPSGFEVDFHARNVAGDEMLIQVCATLDDPDTLAREVRALQDAAQAYPHATLHLIALNFPASIQVPAGIQLHRASNWLLGA